MQNKNNLRVSHHKGSNHRSYQRRPFRNTSRGIGSSYHSNHPQNSGYKQHEVSCTRCGAKGHMVAECMRSRDAV